MVRHSPEISIGCLQPPLAVTSLNRSGGVACGMTVAVVQGFEVVEIEEEHRAWMGVAASPADLTIER